MSKWTLLCLSTALLPQCFGQFNISPATPLNLKYTFGDPFTPPPASENSTTAVFGIYAPGLSYVLDHVEAGANNPPNFLILTPKNGSGSVNGIVGLNPEVVRQMQPGSYTIFAVYKTTDPVNPEIGKVSINFLLEPGTKVPQIQSVASSVSLQSNLSPGALVSILGSNLGNAGKQTFDGFGFYPTTAGGTTVTFNGIRAPLLKVTPKRIDALVPYEMVGQASADVVVTRYSPDFGSNLFTVPITSTAPVMFTADGSGTGQGLINTANGMNSSANPVAQGALINFRVAGVGQYISAVQGLGLYPPLQLDGQVAVTTPSLLSEDPFAHNQPVIPFTVTIGGVSARQGFLQPIYYEVWDLLYVSVVVPNGIASGQQPIVVRIGNYDNSQQNVTVSIQ